ncbi:T9SS type A sorting domain-containing protein [Chryseobacterium sp. Tr-659]|uniref:T9SS type A sorting domain-containing protein n=1 Tax=Chryseobacterium sp. Tr-659 TaxID=2608340 RepID=UPI00141EC168|nr:T9SS type A sorting domain-containing protein [Chryseobacterium sp. Tr-659]NIF04999.1 T9SS type A sorting domain-containing protein [Chryseobacterium sp. Tr-659]
MKKFYIFAISLISISAFAQQTISFEASEGFIAGNINGQKGWVSTNDGGTPPVFITSQVVSSEVASQGSNSFKVTTDPAFAPQQSPVMGGFYSFTAPLTYNSFTQSFDVRLTQKSSTSSDFVFRNVNDIGTGGIVTYIDFSYNGKILIANAGSTSLVDTNQTWNINTWYRVKMVSTATGIQYYLNDTLIYTGQPYSNNNITRMDFVNDNYGGSAYIDNIKINNETALSTKDAVKHDVKLSIYPNPATDVIKISTSNKIQHVEAYDMAGKRVKVTLDGDKVDVRNLPSGAYLLNIETTDRNFTEKFIKK